MSTNAVINFLFNAAGAVKQLDNFKSKVRNVAADIGNSFTAKIGSLGALLTGAASMKELYDKTLALSELSERFRLPIEEVSKFANVIGQFGGNTEQAASILKTLETGIADLKYKAGGGVLNSALSQSLGLNIRQGETSLSLLSRIREKMKGLNTDAQNTVLNDLGFGDNQAMLRLMRASDEEFRQITSNAAKFGVITKDTQQTVIRIERAIATVRQSMLTIGASLFETFAPVIDKIAMAFEALATQSEGVRLAVLGVIGALSLLALNPYVAAITGIAVAAGYIIENWEKVKALFSSFGAVIEKALLAPFDAVVESLEVLFDIVLKGWDKFKNMVGNIPGVKGIFSDDKMPPGGVSAATWQNMKPLNSSVVNNSTVNNSSPRVNNNMTFNITGTGNPDATAQAIGRVIKQQSTGVAY